MASVKTDPEIAFPPEDAGSEPAEGTKVSWESLERQDWHLWVLAMLLMFVLGVSLLSFMFPSVFWFRERLPFAAPAQAFVGFCVLLALALVYMLQRQATVRRLKRSLFQAREQAAAAHTAAAVQAFASLPGIGQFRDSLAMEYLRCTRTRLPVSLVLVQTREASREQIGRMATLLCHMLRRREMLFRLSDNALGLILPGMELTDAEDLAAHLHDRVSLYFPKLETAEHVTGYPDRAGSLAEMETPLRMMVS